MSVRAILAVLLTGIALAACGAKMKPGVAAPEQLPDQESWNSRVVFSDSGQVRAVLRARHIRMYQQRQETIIDSGLVVDFYDKQQQHTSRLTADSGRVDDATRNLEAFGRVVFTSDSGTVVRTEYLFWENATKMVRGNRFVTITSPTEYLQGNGFEADQHLKNYTIFGTVSGEAEIKKR